MTQTDFGLKAGIGRERLAKYEIGLVPLPWSVAEFICKTFDLNPGWLATGNGPAEPYIVPPSMAAAGREQRLFSEVFDAEIAPFLDQILSAGLEPAKGVKLRPSRTGTSYEAFRAMLDRVDALYREIKGTEPRAELSRAIWDVWEQFQYRVYRTGEIKSHILRRDR